jgi:2'-5' RNA ligase
MKSLYLLALLPPEPVFAETWALKQEVHRLTGSRNAVRLPPMRLEDELEGAVAAALAGFADTQRAFPVALRDFAWFGNRTLFVHVSEREALQTFHAVLHEWCAVHLPQVPRESRPFYPHLTLATRDLPAVQVPELKALFAARSYVGTFEVKNVTLFRHDGQQWEPRATFVLGQNPN